MVLCLDGAAQHSTVLARALVKSLEEPELESDTALARLFLVSDVLYNSSSSSTKGAARYRSSFQELLPDALERLGRQWLRRPGRQPIAQARAEAGVRGVLDIWREWSIFPHLFPRGLEALLFAPVPEVVHPEAEADKELRWKLEQWTSPAAATRSPLTARLRGLSGPTLPAATCILRLCHYERYWHRSAPVGATNVDFDFDEDLDGQPLSDDDMDLDGEALADCELRPSSETFAAAVAAWQAQESGDPASHQVLATTATTTPTMPTTAPPPTTTTLTTSILAAAAIEATLEPHVMAAADEPYLEATLDPYLEATLEPQVSDDSSGALVDQEALEG
ncbi:unnamed protein product, partial [Polarella glacialis]